MSRITDEENRDEWEASTCAGKRTYRCHIAGGTRTEYYLCGACSKRIKDPTHDEPCLYGPRPPCSSMKQDEPLAGDVLSEFLSTVEPKKHCTENDIVETIELFKTAMSREWSCFDCQYWEAPGGGGYKEAFLSTHGVSKINSGEIDSFCSWFVIRKCMMSDNERRKSYTVMSKLADFLFEKEHMSAEERKEVKRGLANCRAVNCDKIVQALDELYNNGYWTSLEEEDSEKYPYGDEYVHHLSSEMPLEVVEVTEEGWRFGSPVDCGYGSGSDDEDHGSNAYFVRLPKQVANLGRKGMTISCMNLRYRRGVWSPFNPYGDDGTCANVYPC